MPRRRPSWVSTVRRSLGDLVTFVRLGLTSRAGLAAENLFLRKQLALYQERHTKPKRPDPATRVALVLLSRLLDWRSMLTVVQPDTLIQQFRMTTTGERAHRYLVHDRDGIFTPAVDHAVASMGLRVLKTPMRTPQANAFCERVIGTMRRECLDWLIPFNERHLRRMLTEWVAHYHCGRPHTSLGPICQNLHPRHTGHSRLGIISPMGTASRRRRFWPDCTMSIVWWTPRDPATEWATLLRSTSVRR